MRNERLDAKDALLAAVRNAARQEQFLEVISPADARLRFEKAIDFTALPAEAVSLADALDRVLATDLAAPTDVPAFDRSGVDGFAVRAADTTGAAERMPHRLRLNAEVIACGHPPVIEVAPGTASTIATGGMIPRGADAVVMVEYTELVESPDGPAIELRRAVAPGQFVAFAGSDIARGETVLRRGQRLGSREIGMLAACGFAEVAVVRRPRVAVLSTGDELVSPGAPLPPAGVYDSNGAIVAAAVTEAGGEPVRLGAYPDNEKVLEAAVRSALASCDMVVLSGGTSKGAGDLSHRILSRLGKPGVLVHGVALKPGKPLCLAVVDGKPVVVLPGFPTSAIFTFHEFVAPVIRARAGLPAHAAETVAATVPLRIASEMGRQEFVLVALVPGEHGPVAFPIGKGSGAVTSFSQADGFLAIDALSSGLDAGTPAEVTLIGRAVACARHRHHGKPLRCARRGDRPARRPGFCRPRRRGGQHGRRRRDRARRMRRRPGTSPRSGDGRLQSPSPAAGRRPRAGVAAHAGLRVSEGRRALCRPHRAGRARCGLGRSVMPDGQPQCRRRHPHPHRPAARRSAAAGLCQPAEVAQCGRGGGRAEPRRLGHRDRTGSGLYGLDFLPIAPEHYDFLVIETRRDRPAVKAFLAALAEPETRKRIESLGMTPAEHV